MASKCMNIQIKIYAIMKSGKCVLKQMKSMTNQFKMRA